MKKKLLCLNIFVFYSIIGYFFEMILSFILKKDYTPMLNLPWTPLYGFGVVIIYYLDLFLSKKNINKKYLYFIIITFLMTFIEWLSGILTEKILGSIEWSYDKIPLHIGHYISVPTSLLWGIISLIINYKINPKLIKIINKTPYFITLDILFLFLLDVINLLLK